METDMSVSWYEFWIDCSHCLQITVPNIFD